MDHRQRMIAGNKIQQMLKNESYKEFPEVCRGYAERLLRILEKKGLRDRTPYEVFTGWSLQIQKEGGWLYLLADDLFRKASQKYPFWPQSIPKPNQGDSE